jgi:hypothetical protein
MKILKTTVSEEERDAVIRRAKSQGRSVPSYLRWLIWQDIPSVAPVGAEKGR